MLASNFPLIEVRAVIKIYRRSKQISESQTWLRSHECEAVNQAAERQSRR